MTIEPEMLDPISPGEVLREEFLFPHGLTVSRLARDLGVPPGRISQIVRNRRAITADTALRLARYFGTSPQFWLSLQNEYDLREALRNSGATLEATIRPLAEEAVTLDRPGRGG